MYELEDSIQTKIEKIATKYMEQKEQTIQKKHQKKSKKQKNQDMETSQYVQLKHNILSQMMLKTQSVKEIIKSQLEI